MSALFVLLRSGQDLEEFRRRDPAVREAIEQASLRRYPEASDRDHIFSLVRDARDPHATRWLRGLLLAIATGAVVGAILNAVLSVAFGMFSGLSSLAIPLGFFVGAFLGAFTALMTGTHKARPDLHSLLEQTEAGDVLLQWNAKDRAVLQRLRTHCEAIGTPCLLLD